MTEKFSKTLLKHEAQAYLMKVIQEAVKAQEVSRVVGTIPTTQWEEFQEVLENQSDRIARLFGY